MTPELGDATFSMYPSSRFSRNKFVELLAGGLNQHGVMSELISSRSLVPIRGTRALILHWPENLLLAPRPAAKVLWGRLMGGIKRTRASGGSVVWYAHNLLSEDLAADPRFDYLTSQLDGVVYLTHASRNRPEFKIVSHLPSRVIPHHSYGTESLATAGEYPKNLLLWDRPPTDRRAELDSFDSRVKIWVRSTDSRRNHSRATVLPERLPDHRLDKLLRDRTVVALEVDRINSGMTMHALSRNARVILPKSPESLEMADLIGRDWVGTTEDSQRLSEHLFLEAPFPSEPPELTRLSSCTAAKALINFVTSIVV